MENMMMLQVVSGISDVDGQVKMSRSTSGTLGCNITERGFPKLSTIAQKSCNKIQYTPLHIILEYNRSVAPLSPRNLCNIMQ